MSASTLAMLQAMKHLRLNSVYDFRGPFLISFQVYSIMWKSFARFCSKELATGGPDPQIATLAELAKDHGTKSRVWLIGCYGAHHCVPSAYLIGSQWTA